MTFPEPLKKTGQHNLAGALVLLATFFALVVVLGLAGCSSDNTQNDSSHLDASTSSVSTEDDSSSQENAESSGAEDEDEIAFEGITSEAALDIALSDAELNAKKVTVTKQRLERDDGLIVYEVEFHTKKTAYDYTIDAVTGEIVEKEQEPYKKKSALASNTASGSNSPSNASGGSGKNVTGGSGTNASSGASANGSSAHASSTNSKGQQKNNGLITLSAAKAIAAEHAGYSASQVTFTSEKLNRDNGLQIYEIEFIVGKIEYEYEINAITGDVIDYEADRN